MSDFRKQQELTEHHPWPDQVGVKCLYRFMSIREDNIEHVSDLLKDGKLYHATSNQLNDPFECKPHFSWPESAEKVRKIRKHLIKIARNDGKSKKEAEALLSKSMSKPGFLRDTIYNSILKTFSKLRLCSFTTKKDNLLFWSHYANSHTGFCIEFDANVLPISSAYKVKYQAAYPAVEYPQTSESETFKPALIKSKTWEYEEEFRTIFNPASSRQPKNDGKSLILKGNEIKNIYFGPKTLDENKEKILDFIRQGPFTPGIWNTYLSSSSFELDFKKQTNA